MTTASVDAYRPRYIRSVVIGIAIFAAAYAAFAGATAILEAVVPLGHYGYAFRRMPAALIFILVLSAGAYACLLPGARFAAIRKAVRLHGPIACATMTAFTVGWIVRGMVATAAGY